MSNSLIASEAKKYSCDNSRSLGYQITWTGAQKGSASGDRSGRFWEFIGQSIIFNLQTPFRKDIGQVWFAHPETDIEYLPGNEYQLTFGKKKQADHAKLRINSPWYEGVTQKEAGYLSFKIHTLKPTESPCLAGEGEVIFNEEHSDKTITVKLNFAVDVMGSKFRS